jgi:hypothetical protein
MDELQVRPILQGVISESNLTLNNQALPARSRQGLVSKNPGK